MAVSTCTKTMVDSMLPYFTAQKAVDLQVFRARKDLFLDLFSSSTVQMENHHGQLVPTTVFFGLYTANFIDRGCSLRSMNKD